MKNKNDLLAQVRRLLGKPRGVVKLENIYLVKLGRSQGQTIWVVHGGRVHRLLYPHFLSGGNDQRYRYTPENEVWIDHRMGLSELRYTILHELLERKLMRERGWSYNRAHKEALAAEEKARLNDEHRCARKEDEAAILWSTCWRKSALRIGSTKRHSIYRAFYGTVKGMKVWLVDGTEVRRMLDGNFLYAGHDLNAGYIPKGEIWLDLNISCEEAWFSLQGELASRQAKIDGHSDDLSDKIGLVAQWREWQKQEVLSRKHEVELPPVRYGVRERGHKKK